MKTEISQYSRFYDATYAHVSTASDAKTEQGEITSIKMLLIRTQLNMVGPQCEFDKCWTRS